MAQSKYKGPSTIWYIISTLTGTHSLISRASKKHTHFSRNILRTSYNCLQIPSHPAPTPPPPFTHSFRVWPLLCHKNLSFNYLLQHLYSLVHKTTFLIFWTTLLAHINSLRNTQFAPIMIRPIAVGGHIRRRECYSLSLWNHPFI